MSNVYTISPWTPAGAAARVPCDIPAHATGLIVTGNLSKRLSDAGRH
jgi:hypothetical protein